MGSLTGQRLQRGPTHEYRGLWWLPSDESQRLSGTLTVTKGEASLELIGHFGHELRSETETEKTYSLALAEQPRIVGLSTGGESITLEGHRVANHTESFPGIPTPTYKRNVTLIGKQFADGEEIGFDEIAICTSDLNTWTQVSGFDTTVGMEKHKENDYYVFSNLAIRFEAPDDIEIALARGERAFIRFNAPSEGIVPGTDHVALRREHQIGDKTLWWSRVICCCSVACSTSALASCAFSRYWTVRASWTSPSSTSAPSRAPSTSASLPSGNCRAGL